MANNKQLIEGIVECLGGAENITSCWHCATRLRFELKDWGLVKNDALDKVKGVLGKSVAGSQLQLIIGPGVAEVYEELCETYHIAKQAAIDENLDSKGALTFRKVLNNIVTAIADSFIPIIPAIVASSFISASHRCGFSILIWLITSIPKFRCIDSSRRMYWNCSATPVILLRRPMDRIWVKPQ